MNANDYQKKAHEFAQYGDRSYPYLGLAEEAGEVCGRAAKFTRHNDGIPPWKAKEAFPGSLAHPLLGFREAMRKELGDVLWMVAEVATLNDLTLEELMEGNIAKLEDRRARGVVDGEGDER